MPGEPKGMSPNATGVGLTPYLSAKEVELIPKAWGKSAINLTQMEREV